MPYDPVERFGFGKIQEIDDIIPAGIQEQGMLVGDKSWCVVTVVLIDRSYFKLTISQGGDSCLRSDDSGLRCESALVEGDIKVKRPERENVENCLLASCSWGQHQGEYI